MSKGTLPAPSPIVQIENGDPGVVYREVVGYLAYAVGDDGSLWTQLKRQGSLRYQVSGVWKQMKPTIHHTGYRVSRVTNAIVTKNVRISNLVAEAFLGRRPNRCVACHNNGVRNDDRADNIRWDTQSGNLADRVTHGTNITGSRNGRAVLTDDQVRCIRLRRNEKRVALAREFGVNVSTIFRALSRRSWSDTT